MAIAVAIKNIAVDTVICSRDFATREPSPVIMCGTILEDFGRSSEDPLGPLVPAEFVCLVRLKGLNIIHGASVHSVLYTERHCRLVAREG